MDLHVFLFLARRGAGEYATIVEPSLKEVQRKGKLMHAFSFAFGKKNHVIATQMKMKRSFPPNG
jgi:hypothetical protein